MSPLRRWIFAIFFLALAPPSPVFAGSSPFSSVEPGRPRPRPGAIRSLVTFDDLESIFNVTISLHDNPTGDDDATVDQAGDEAERPYEAIIRQFADAVCEESNGAHHLGEVRIFRNGQQSAHADIVWNEREWPRANVAGFQTDGLHIFFGDVFPDGCGAGCDKDMLADATGSGYTLAHEWGHYVYGLYDEYRAGAATGAPGMPRGTDTPVEPAIMNRQWNATGGNFDWLNHSTANNFHTNTAQGRVYGKSGWEVLVQLHADDPRAGDRTAQPERRHFLSLDGDEPTAADGWIRKELPGDRLVCRSDLEIRWVSNVEMQIVLDRSGSMAGTPLDYARTAASLLVDVVPEGQTALGVVQFDDAVDQLVPITPIPSPGAATKAGIKAAIGSIYDRGLTAIFDAATLALSNLTAYRAAHHTSAAQVVFLLSDGGDNSSAASASDVTAAYRAADVPLFTFAYGFGADADVLRQLSDDTGGYFFSSPTSLSEIESAFLLAAAELGTSTSVVAATPSVPAGGTASETFVVDPTLASFVAIVTFPAAASSLDLALAGPGGAPAASFACVAAGTGTSCTAQVDAPAAGTWSLTARNGTGSELPLRVDVVATPKPGRSFALTVAPVGGSRVVYPAPIVLTAAVSRGLPITGVGLAAEVTDPSGTTSAFAMNDEGRDGDAVAGDGLYSAILGYEEDGVYGFTVRVDNDAGRAAFTTAGFQPTLAEDGSEPVQRPLPPITENFSRAARAQVTVEGVADDDHAGAPPGTRIAADNVDVLGRIDFAGDVDEFEIDPVDTTKALVVRVTSLALGMEPELTVLRADGTTVVASGTRATTVSANGYVALTIAPADLDPAGRMVARVRHVDPTAAQGTYALSAGAAVHGDAAPAPDQFRCYRAKGKAERTSVVVGDAFEQKVMTLVRPVRVCTPVDRDGSGITTPDAWLTCFTAADARTKPRQPRFQKRTTTLRDVFGSHQVVAREPSVICLPAGQDRAPARITLDPQKCYAARGTGATPAGTTLTDVFGARATKTSRSVELCNAAALGGGKVPADRAGLLCYRTKDAKTKPRQKPFKAQTVRMVTPLGDRTFRLTKPDVYCAPTAP